MFEKGHEKIGGRCAGTPNKRTRLMKALEIYELKKDRNYLEKYFEEAWNDRQTLRDLMGKLYPDLKAVEADIAYSDPVKLILHVGGRQIELDGSPVQALPQSKAMELIERRDELPSPPDDPDYKDSA